MTEMVNHWADCGCRQAVVGGVYQEDRVTFPEGVTFYPVLYRSKELPFPITGMSDEMPYESLRYRDMTEEIVQQYRERFREVIEKAVEELNPDVLVCHHLYLLTAFVREWFPERKILAFSHGSDLRQICKNPLKREYIIGQIGKLDRIIALHRSHREEIQRIFPVKEDRIGIAGVGYNRDIFSPGERREKPYRQIVFAGKVTEKKGIFSLLAALEKLPYQREELVVKLAGGHGPAEEFEQIRRLAAESCYRVELTGALPQEELAELFRESDLFVLPSFFEGLPLVLMEAMACGCKVICSKLPGIPAWFREQVPGADIAFVDLPGMKNTDEPKPEELPGFKSRLAEAIVQKLEEKEQEIPDLSEVSWAGISRRILEKDIGIVLKDGHKILE